jgi:FkbM family methyltransferase
MEIIREVWSGIYERDVRVSQGDVVVDAGAQIGIFSVKVADRAGRVWAFEPEPSNYELLCYNVAPYSNIKSMNVALWSSNGRMPLHHNREHVGAHSLLPLPEGVSDYNVEVETIRLDDVIEDQVDFIKMDVEGAEIEVLKGAMQILEVCHPAIVMEVHPIKPLEEWWGRLMDVLVPLGYKIVPQPMPSDMWCRKIVTAL